MTYERQLPAGRTARGTGDRSPRGARRGLRQQRRRHHRRRRGGGEKLTVGSDVPYPPFEEFGKTKTEFKGFDVEVVEAIAEKIGRTPEFKDTSFDTIFRDLAQGKFDMVASATTITDEREETVDFTNPYYLPSAQSIVVKKGNSDLKTGKDLEGLVVGVQQGTTGEEYVEEEIKTKELRTYPQGPDTVPALKAGTIDAIVIDRPVAENIIEADSGLEISGGIETEEQYGFVVQQGDEELLDELNEGLEEVIDSGEYETIYKKWFHKPVPPGIGTTTHEAT